MNREIVDYYDRQAATYDRDRFGSNYGKFIDIQERRILNRWLSGADRRVLEIACGTGRLSDFALFACDASLESLKIARRRRPSTCFVAADATQLPFKTQSIDAVFAFHIFMHLDRGSIRSILAEAARVLRDRGLFIADVASATRRRTGSRPAGESAPWHGSTALSAAEFKMLCSEFGLRPVRMTGIMFIPIHRMPDRLRPFLLSLDRWLSARLPSLSSYLAGCFIKGSPP
jgi:ubiquinone/menaquinone biosynthesis C-methylase UbiE